MTYPNSSDVSSGQPTAAAHYNNLRKDALTLGQAPADSLNLADFFARHAANIKLTYLATNRIRVLFNSYHPAVVMVGGCMLKATANIDLPAGYFAGGAATFYIHAVRTPGSTTFTINANTTPVESATSRVIGTCYWDGTNISNILSYYLSDLNLPQSDYDSGWFAVSYNTTYTKAHGLSEMPRLVILFHSTAADGSSDWVRVFHTYDGTSTKAVLSANATNIIITTGNNASNGCCFAYMRVSGSGYYRVLAWK